MVLPYSCVDCFDQALGWARLGQKLEDMAFIDRSDSGL